MIASLLVGETHATCKGGGVDQLRSRGNGLEGFGFSI